MKKKFAPWLLVIAVLVGSFLRGQDLLQPYEDGVRGVHAAFFALMAKNHLRYGLATTGGVGIINPDRVGPRYFNYFLDHPPGAVWLATAGALLGGTNPAGLRLAFLPLSIGIVLLVYRLAKRRGKVLAATAGALAATLPIGIYYGTHVHFEVPTLFLILLTTHQYLRYRRRGRRKHLVRSLVAFAAAVGFDWIALALPVCLLVLEPLRERSPGESRRVNAWLHGLGLLGIGLLVLVVVQVVYQLQLGRYGVASSSQGTYPEGLVALFQNFQPDRFLSTLCHLSADSFGWLTWLALLGLPIAIAGAVRRRLDEVSLTGLTFLLLGLINLAIMYTQAREFDYYHVLQLLPAVCILGALALHWPFQFGPQAVMEKLLPGLLILLLIWQTSLSVQLLSSRRSFGLSELGQRLASCTEPGTVILVGQERNTMDIQVAVSADRHVEFVHDVSGLTGARRKAEYLGMVAAEEFLYLDGGDTSLITPDLAHLLERLEPAMKRAGFSVYRLPPR